MTMLEKAAKAAYETYRAAVPLNFSWKSLPEDGKKIARDQVRAILEEIREPNLDVISSGVKAWPFEEVAPTTAATRMFTAMIDAILGETE